MVELRTPKGTLDYSPTEAQKVLYITNTIKCVFEKHGGEPIVTPTFELRELLTNKYGDDSKLIYDLADQGGDVCSLRYDLTVPFSRYLASNRVNKMRKYQIGNVYRRDNPSFKTGRLREFTQADFDICGPGVPGLHDAEVVAMLSEILSKLCPERPFKVRINDRRILGGIMDMCGIRKEKHATICSSIDKLDKVCWNDILPELNQKGLGSIQIYELEKYIVEKRSNQESIRFLREKSQMSGDEEFIEGVDDLERIFEYASSLGATNLEIDISLARGLDYYTGAILEAYYLGTDVGSVAGGGRYDSLCSSIGGIGVQCVGFSVGVSRLLSLIEYCSPKDGVFVGASPGDTLDKRMKCLRDLWSHGIRAVTFSRKRSNFADHLKAAEKGNFKYLVSLGGTTKDGKVEGSIVIDLESGKKETLFVDNICKYLISVINKG